MNPLRALTETIADRLCAGKDAHDRAYGLTVDRLPWGRRRVYDRRVPVWLDQRRLRVVENGLDDTDRALLDPATNELLANTARRMKAKRSTDTRRDLPRAA